MAKSSQPKPVSLRCVGGIDGKVVAASVLGVKQVEFAPHATEQMKIRSITEQEVLRVLEAPQKRDLPTQGGRERWRRYRHDHEAVDVVFTRHPDRIVVITAIKVDIHGR